MNPPETPRSAHAAIAGYLYQALITLKHWLDIDKDSVIFCEGREDFDTRIFGSDGKWKAVDFNQIKLVQSNTTAKSDGILNSVCDFYLFVNENRAAIPDMWLHFITTSGIGVSRQDDFLSPVTHYRESRDKRHLQSFRDRLKSAIQAADNERHAPVLETITSIDEAQLEYLITHISMVPDQPGLDQEMDIVREKIANDYRFVRLANLHGLLFCRLFTYVLETCAKTEMTDRALRQSDLGTIMAIEFDQLDQWTGTVSAENLANLIKHMCGRDLALGKDMKLLHDKMDELTGKVDLVLQSQNYSSAILLEIREAVTQKPGNDPSATPAHRHLETLINKAEGNLNGGLYDDALRILESALLLIEDSTPKPVKFSINSLACRASQYCRPGKSASYALAASQYAATPDGAVRRRAVERFFNEDYAKALTLIDAALDIDPTSIHSIKLKGQILFCTKRFAEAQSVFSEIGDDDPEKCTLIACCLVNVGNYAAARAYLEKSPSLPTDCSGRKLAGESFILQAKARLDAEGRQGWTPHTHALLDKAFAELHAAQALCSSQNSALAHRIQCSLAIANLVNGRFSEAAACYRTVHDAGALNVQDLHNYHVALSRSGDFSNAIRIGELVAQNPPDYRGNAYMLAHDCLSNGQIDKAKAITGLYYETTGKYLLDLNVKIMIAEHNPVQAKQFAELHMASLDEPTEARVALVVALESCSEIEEAMRVLQELVDDSSLPIGHREDYQYQLLILSVKHITKNDHTIYRDIFVKFKHLFSPYINDHVNRSIAILAYNAREYGECLRMCADIQDFFKSSLPHFKQLESRIWYFSDQFVLARAGFKYLIGAGESSLEIKIQYGYCLYRLGSADESALILMQCEQECKKPENAKYAAIELLSLVYSMSGYYQKALECALIFLQGHFDSARAHAFYIHMSQLCFSKIAEPDAIYRNQYRDSITNMKTRFPGNDFIIEVRMDGEGIQPLLDIIKKHSDDCKNIVEIYQLNLLPAGFLAKGLGKNISGVVSASLDKSSGISFHGESGMPQVMNDEMGRIEFDRDLIIDLPSYLVLEKINKLNYLKIFKKVYISQSWIDDVHQDLTRLTMSSGRGYMTVSHENGTFLRTEVSPEQIDLAISHLRKRIRDIPQFAEIFGKSPNRWPLPKQNHELLSMLGDPYLESAWEGHHRKCQGLFAEALVRITSTVKCFGIRALIERLAMAGSITRMEMSSAIIALISCNFSKVSVTDRILVDALILDNGTSGHHFKTVLTHLSQPGWDLPGHIRVFAGFFNQIRSVAGGISPNDMDLINRDVTSMFNGFILTGMNKSSISRTVRDHINRYKFYQNSGALGVIATWPYNR